MDGMQVRRFSSPYIVQCSRVGDMVFFPLFCTVQSCVGEGVLPLILYSAVVEGDWVFFNLFSTVQLCH